MAASSEPASPHEAAHSPHRVRVGAFATHPIQYQAPLWRRLAKDPRFQFRVFYFSAHGSIPTFDPGFGQAFAWDVPLLAGYGHEFITRAPLQIAHEAAIPDFENFLREQRLDVVLVHGYFSAHAKQLIRAARRGNYKIVVRGEFSDLASLHQPWWRRAARNLWLRTLYRQVDAFSSIGADATAHLLSHGVPDEKIFLASYSVDDELIARQKVLHSRAKARRDLDIDERQFVILFSGKLIPRKQPILLAQAIARLPHHAGITACFLGSGELFEPVKNYLGPILGRRLLMPGFVNQSALGPYFAAADVFSLPTAHDTWGLVVNEAMHWGLPCLVSDQAGCCRDLIDPGITGFTHKADDVVGLAALLQRLLADRAATQRMGDAAASRISNFTADKTATAIADTLWAVAQANPSQRLLGTPTL